jgi:sugar diacid utilization regulator
VAKTLAELIIHQMSVIEHLPQQKWVRDTFISDLLHQRVHGSADVMLHEAKLLGIDLDVPWIVAVVNIKPLIDQSIRAHDPRPRQPLIDITYDNRDEAVVSHDEASDTYIVASGWGEKADWLRNIQKNPNVLIDAE